MCGEWVILQIKPNELLTENLSLELERVTNWESINESCVWMRLNRERLFAGGS